LCFIPPGRENTGIFTGPFSRSLSWILAFEINKAILTISYKKFVSEL
jgi:hypothetical protein